MRQTFRAQAVRIDRFCARLNTGLTAVALVLALITVVAATVRVEQRAAAAGDRVTVISFLDD